MKGNKKISRILTIHLEEFKTTRQDITSFISHQNQMLNFAIAIIGGTITLMAVNLNGKSIVTELPYVLLIASILLSAISWRLIEIEFQIHDLAVYLEKSLIPKIRYIVPHRNNIDFMVLEYQTIRRSKPGRVVIRGVLGIGKFLISYLPSVIFIIIFSPIREQIYLPLDWTETFLYWLALGMVCVSPIAMIINYFFLGITYREPGEEKEQDNEEKVN